MRPMAKQRINNALRYLGFRNRCNGPGELGSCRAVDKQRPGPAAGGGREEGWMSAPLHCRCGPAVLPALTSFGSALVILFLADSQRCLFASAQDIRETHCKVTDLALTASSCQPSGEGE